MVNYPEVHGQHFLRGHLDFLDLTQRDESQGVPSSEELFKATCSLYVLRGLSQAWRPEDATLLKMRKRCGFSTNLLMGLFLL